MGLIPGNSNSLWQSVNQARDMNHDEMPDKMYLNGNEIINSSRIKVGKNILPNRLGVLNNKIKLQWMNQSLETFKLKCKDLFLT